MFKVIVSPFSKKLKNGKQNAKSPSVEYWSKVMSHLRQHDITTIQVGITGEPWIGADFALFDLSLMNISDLVSKADSWLSVDNFMNHLGSSLGKKGVVIFSRSDPDIFGYRQNINLLKNRSFLRPDQFGFWHECDYVEDAFISPDVVANEIASLKGFSA